MIERQEEVYRIVVTIRNPKERSNYNIELNHLHLLSDIANADLIKAMDIIKVKCMDDVGKAKRRIRIAELERELQELKNE
jgi:hypothetical protein